jgi:TnpA family transposase
MERISRIIYPAFPAPLTQPDIERYFAVDYSERTWALSVARRGPSLVALLAHLKVFLHLGRFLQLSELPRTGVAYIEKQLVVDVPANFDYDRRTLYRHHRAIREYLHITPWGAKAREVAAQAIAQAAETRLDPVDLINAAIDALIRERCELPRLSTLRTLAATAHRSVNAAQWQEVYRRLTLQDRARLDDLLATAKAAKESAFAALCRGPGKPTRENLKTLIAHYRWLITLIDPAPLLASVSETKVAQWANEAQRLKARELREYVAPRRFALTLAVVKDRKSQILDDLTVMLIRFAGRIEWRSASILREWQDEHRDNTEELIRALADLLIIVSLREEPARTVEQLDASIAAHGGLEHLRQACAEHLKHAQRNWEPFAREAFSPFRSQLLLLARTLPLKAARPSAEALLTAVDRVSEEPSDADYLIMELDFEFLPSKWRPLIEHHDPAYPPAFKRRELEVCVMLELAEAIKAGAVHVVGSKSYDDFWDKLPPETSDPERLAAYVTERGWPAGAEGFTRGLRQAMTEAAQQLNIHVGLLRQIRLDGRRKPIIKRLRGTPPPASALEAARQLADAMPERSVLQALANTAQWVDWPRHFGLPSRLGSGIKNPLDRYLITTFAYGCGLGATQAARHFSHAVDSEDLSFVDRRHIDIANLRAGSADLQNLYTQFELPKLWGTGESAAADGTHFETFRDNLLAARHFRYGRTGGIAYRHVSDNYIALFSRFIGCGVYEATYILDILCDQLSDLRPTKLHSDSHGQSAHVFGLAYLVGIELLPRIRGWKRLRLYRPGKLDDCESIEHLFSATINWQRIEQHYPDFLRLAVAIHSGKIAPSAILARINSQSTRDPFAMALQELGHAVRTTFLLRWVCDQELRQVVHKATTKVERSHQFAKFLDFGGEGGLRSNNPADQEKAIVYNELVANAVALQTVADQTQALHSLRARGIAISPEDLAYMSPYPTSRLKRFGQYPAAVDIEDLPLVRTLPTSPAPTNAAPFS